MGKSNSIGLALTVLLSIANTFSLDAEGKWARATTVMIGTMSTPLMTSTTTMARCMEERWDMGKSNSIELALTLLLKFADTFSLDAEAKWARATTVMTCTMSTPHMTSITTTARCMAARCMVARCRARDGKCFMRKSQLSVS